MDLEKYKNNIGIERLKFHYKESDYIDENFLVKRYILNIKISQALYPILSIVEVYLRNSIDVMLQALYGVDWLEKETIKQRILLKNDYEKLMEAVKTLKMRYKNNPVTRGKIIAELNLGFWVSLCSKKYNPIIWFKKNAFRMVFPRFPKTERENIAIISKKLIQIKSLRNRVFHYEPILKSDNEFSHVYNEIIDVLKYLPQGNEEIIKETNNFNTIINEVVKELKFEIARLESKKL